MKRFREYLVEESYVLIEQSLADEIKNLVKDGIKGPAEKALSKIKSALIKKLTPKIKAWGLANAHLIKIDKKFANTIKDALNNPDKLISKMFDNAIKNGNIKV